MSGRNTKFELINGRIYLTYEQLVWGEWLEVFKEDVTDKVMPIVDDFDDHLDKQLGNKPKPKAKKSKTEDSE